MKQTNQTIPMYGLQQCVEGADQENHTIYMVTGDSFGASIFFRRYDGGIRWCFKHGMHQAGLTTMELSPVPAFAAILQLAVNQKTGSFPLPLPGCKLTYFQAMNDDKWGTGRRKISISGGTATVSSSGGYLTIPAGTEPAVAAFLIFQIERA